jgi:hypothetical protein
VYFLWKCCRCRIREWRLEGDCWAERPIMSPGNGFRSFSTKSSG